MTALISAVLGQGAAADDAQARRKREQQQQQQQRWWDADVSQRAYKEQLALLDQVLGMTPKTGGATAHGGNSLDHDQMVAKKLSGRAHRDSQLGQDSAVQPQKQHTTDLQFKQQQQQHQQHSHAGFDVTK